MLVVGAIVLLLIVGPPWGVVALVAAGILEVAEVYFWRWFTRRGRVSTGAEGMIGARAIVVEECRPDGLVQCKGELWRARAAQGAGAGAGEEVVVATVEGLTLTVKPG